VKIPISDAAVLAALNCEAPDDSLDERPVLHDYAEWRIDGMRAALAAALPIMLADQRHAADQLGHATSRHTYAGRPASTLACSPETPSTRARPSIRMRSIGVALAVTGAILCVFLALAATR
jgi:hypothetical protein